MRFENQTVVVTGAGRGIGYAVAEQFARDGANVIIADSDAEVGKAAATRLNVTFEQLDVCDANEVARLVDTIVARHGRIDVWVNNAGVAHTALAVEMAPQEWDADVATILSGAFYCAHYVGQLMVKQGKGVIVNIGSVNGLFAQKGRAAYGAANAGLNMLTKVLASEWGEFGVRVNAVAPGVIGTDQGQPETESAYLSRIPMGRMGELSDIAEAVTFVASSEASFMTGEVLRVDGGWTAYHLFYPYETAFATAAQK